MIRRWSVLTATVLGAGAIALAAARIPKPSPRVILLFTGEQDGYLLPCGCTKGMLGGIDRRATTIRKIRAEGAPVLILDNGGFIDGVLEQPRLRRTFLLQAMQAMGWTVTGVGRFDLQAGVRRFISACAATSLPVVCANVLDLDGSRLFPADKILVANGVRIGVTAVLDPELIEAASPVRREVLFAEPADKLAEVLTSWRSKTDLKVLLYHGHYQRAAELAKALPDFDLIISGFKNDLEVKQMARVGKTSIVITGVQGKYLGRVDVADTNPPAFSRARSIPLSPEIEKDEDMLAMITLYRSILGDRWEDLVVKRKKRHPSGVRFVASRLCGACHKAAWEKHKETEHYHAMQTLKDDGSNTDPECVYCHVVGLDYLSGFKDMRRTPQHGFVGCDSCHGPGEEHMLNPVMETAPKAEPELCCLSCHNVEHSPKFDYETYWPKVEHPTPPEEAEELKDQ